MQSSNDVQEAPHRKPSFWTRFLLIINFLVIASLAGGIFWTRYQGEQKQQLLTKRAEIRYIEIQHLRRFFFTLYRDAVNVLGQKAVPMILAVLGNHDDRPGICGLKTQHEIEQNERIGVECFSFA